MKLALLTDGISPYVMGGMQKHSYYITKYLAKAGVYVDLYHTQKNFDFDIAKLEQFSEEEKKFIRSFVVDFPDLGKLPGHYLKESYKYSFDVYQKLLQELEGVNFIYAKGFAGWKLIEEKSKGKKFPPIGVKFHGLNMFQAQPNFKSRIASWLFKGPVKFNCLNADYVFSYGGKITSITEDIGVHPEKIVDIPTGIEETWLLPEPLYRGDKTRKFVFIGRYERLKGVEELNKALAQLVGKYHFEFHFVGPIPEKVKIRDENVIYHGTVSDPQKLRILIESIDCLVCPSYSEGMPNVIIEAMSRGLLVVATDVGATNYLVSEKNGVLLERCDVGIICEGLEKVLKLSEQDILKGKQHSYKFAKEYLPWTAVGEKLIAFLEKAVNGSRP